MIEHTMEEVIKVDMETIKYYLKNPKEYKTNYAKYKSAKYADSTNAQVSTSNMEMEVHAAINPTDTNNIVISPIRMLPLGMGLVCPVYYSTDFGDTWQESDLNTLDAVPSSGLGGGDPVFAYDDNGRLYISWIYLFNITQEEAGWGMFWAYSDDGGATFQYADNYKIAYAEGISMDAVTGSKWEEINYLFDKQWMDTDRNPSSPYYNDLYCVLFEVRRPDSVYAITCRKKPADSSSFTGYAEVSDPGTYVDLQFCSIDIGRDGTVHVSFCGTKDGDNWAMYYAQSTDGGQSFSEDVKISNIHFPGLSTLAPGETKTVMVGVVEARHYPCPHIAVDASDGPYSGNIYTFWSADGVDTLCDNGMDIYYSRSTDSGNTWSEAEPFFAGEPGNGTHQYFSSPYVNDEGVLMLTYYDRSGDPANNLTHYVISYSYDGGKSFTNPSPVTTQPTDFSTVLSRFFTGQMGIGEYTQVIATDHYAIPVWTDARNNNGELFSYVAFYPIKKPTAMMYDTTINPTDTLTGSMLSAISNELVFHDSVFVSFYDSLAATYSHDTANIVVSDTNYIYSTIHDYDSLTSTVSYQTDTIDTVYVYYNDTLRSTESAWSGDTLYISSTFDPYCVKNRQAIIDADAQITKHYLNSFYIVKTTAYVRVPTGIPEKISSTVHAPVISRLYPNPTHGPLQLDIKLPRESPVQIKIIDAGQHTLLTEDMGTLPQGDHQLNLQLGKLKAGVYLLLVITDQGYTGRRIIKL